MKTIITGRHQDVTEEMRQYALEKVEKLGKYWDRATSARVTMDVDHMDHLCEIVMEVNRGVTLVGKASAADMFSACDFAEQKLAAQLRKYKERLTDHHRGERRQEVDLTAPPPQPREPTEQTYEDVIEELREGE